MSCTIVKHLERWRAATSALSGLAFATWIVALGTPDTLAQSRIWQLDGDDEFDGLGWAVAGVGDVDGDGRAEVVAGAWLDEESFTWEGSVSLLSGADGTRLHRFYGGGDDQKLGMAVAGGGDFNDDGVPDFAGGAPFATTVNGVGSGFVKVWSGLDGSLLATILGDAGDELGTSLDFVGDLDGDGYDDLAIGSFRDDDGGNNAGSVLVFSGADQSVLLRIDGTLDQSGFAIVSRAGFVDGDSVPDLIIGAPEYDGVFSNGGRATVHSGFDGAVLFTYDASGADESLGQSVAGLGDVNLDGTDDFAVGTGWADVGGTNTGSVWVYSGLDGSLLYQFDGNDDFDYFGFKLAAGGDANGDGYADVLVGAPLEHIGSRDDVGSAYLFSGRTGRELWVWSGDLQNDTFGKVAAADVDGDGLSDVIVGTHLHDDAGEDSGSIQIFRGNDLYLDTPKLEYDPGDTLRLKTDGGPANALAALYVVAVNGGPFFYRISFGTLGDDGNWTYKATVPSGLSGIDIDVMSFALPASGPVLASEAWNVIFR